MTDPDAEALLRAIVRHPDEDTPRLMYADWLEENDRAEEAEFLRVQCRLAAAEPSNPDYPELVDREEELRLWLMAHIPGPRPTFPGGLAVEGGSHWWWKTYRGFPRYLGFDGYERPGVKAMRGLGAALARAFDALPTRWLVVTYISVPQLAALVKQPALGQLTQLTLHVVTSGGGNRAITGDEADEAARLLAKCRYLKGLRGLSLAFGVGDAGCEALADAPWNDLEWFSPICYRFTPAGLDALAGAGWFRRLRELVLDDGLSDLAFPALARLPAFPNLHTLDLSKNGFSEDGWEAFATTRAFPALARLDLSEGDMSGARIDALAAAGRFELRVLNLRATGCRAGGTGAAVARAPWAKALRVLDLSGNSLDPADARAIAACKKFRDLRHLDLSHNTLSPTALSALAGNASLRGLRSLKLAGWPQHNHRLTPAHFDRFLAQLDLPELRHLDLSGRQIGPKAARRLADAKFASLTRLGLRSCKLTDAALWALLESPVLANLIQLELDGNRLTDGPELLADRGVLPRLASCTLGGNAIPAAVTRKLRRRPGVRCKEEEAR
jgi:uncharacterized protein (TIGR02996 family)